MQNERIKETLAQYSSVKAWILTLEIEAEKLKREIVDSDHFKRDPYLVNELSGGLISARVQWPKVEETMPFRVLKYCNLDESTLEKALKRTEFQAHGDQGSLRDDILLEKLLDECVLKIVLAVDYESLPSKVKDDVMELAYKYGETHINADELNQIQPGSVIPAYGIQVNSKGGKK